MLRKIFFSSLAALLPIGFLTSGHAGGSSGDLAIIVNKTAPVSALTGDDLRVIYLGRRETPRATTRNTSRKWPFKESPSQW